MYSNGFETTDGTERGVYVPIAELMEIRSVKLIEKNWWIRYYERFKKCFSLNRNGLSLTEHFWQVVEEVECRSRERR